MGLPPHTKFRVSKSPLKSRGVVGGLVSVVGFTLAATLMSRSLGVPVAKEELETAVGHGKAIYAQAAFWIALVGSVVGLIGNWYRKAKIAFVDSGKNPVASRGVMGNVVAFLTGFWAFALAVIGDADTLRATLDAAKEQWEIIAPAVIGLIGAARGLIGRVEANTTIKVGGPPVEILILFALPIASCTSPTSTTDPALPSDKSGADPALFPPGFNPDAVVEPGLIGAASAALLSAISFEGGYSDGELCGGIKLFGIGPRLCLGFEFPGMAEPDQVVFVADASLDPVDFAEATFRDQHQSP